MRPYWSICPSLREGEHGWMLHARTVRVLWEGKHIVSLWFKTRMEAETVKQSVMNGQSLADAVEGLKTFVLPPPPARVRWKGWRGGEKGRRPTNLSPFTLVQTRQHGQRGWMLRRRRNGNLGRPTLLIHWFIDHDEAVEVRNGMTAGMTFDEAVAAMEARITAECA